MAIRVVVDGNVNVAFKLSKYPQELRNDLITNLNKQGAPIVRRNIKRGMPVSSRAKVHAKSANSLEVKAMGGRGGYRNVGFYIQPKSDYWYLKFPNNGTGTSNGKRPKQFFQRGVRASTAGINRIVTNTIKGMKF